MRKEEERRTLQSSPFKGPFILEPLLALTETLNQQRVISCPQKWDLARQLFLSGKLSIQQRAIKWTTSTRPKPNLLPAQWLLLISELFTVPHSLVLYFSFKKKKKNINMTYIYDIYISVLLRYIIYVCMSCWHTSMVYLSNLTADDVKRAFLNWPR